MTCGCVYKDVTRAPNSTQLDCLSGALITAYNEEKAAEMQWCPLFSDGTMSLRFEKTIV